MRCSYLKYSQKIVLLLTVMLLYVMSFSAAQATMEEALYAARNRDYQEAFNLFMAEAEQGNAEAQYRIAGMYNSGRGVDKNFNLAKEWFNKSADLGHLKAQKRLERLKRKTKTNIKSDLALLKATQTGDASLVSKLIEDDIKINYQDENGITALMVAVQHDHMQIMEILLKNNADSNIVNKNGDTALLIAVSLNMPDCVKILINYQANVDFQDNNKSSALIIATIRENITIVEMLLKNGANIYLKSADNRTAYDIAIGRKNEKLIKAITISGGTKLAKIINEKKSAQSDNYLKSDAVNKRGWTPLMYAAWRGDLAGLASLLKNSPDLNKKNNAGMTALALAAQGGHGVIVEKLLTIGANMNCKDGSLHPIILATKQGHINVVNNLISLIKNNSACVVLLEEALIQSLASGRMEIAELFFKNDISTSSNSTSSTLILMAASADGLLIDKLIKSGADVNAANTSGETALIIAAKTGNKEALINLLHHKAEINKSDHQRRTALVHAAQNNQVTSIKALTKQGADVLWLTAENNTALMLASERGYVSVVEFLVNFENLDQKNNAGDTALIMAARAGFFEVSDILLKHGANPRVSNNKKQKALSVVKAKDEKLFALIEEYSSSRSWLQDIF